MHRISVTLSALAGAAATLALALPAQAGSLPAGSPGLGDPFFPQAGNGGYDVRHYSLRLAYQPSEHRLDGTAVILARATQDLGSFDLDLRDLNVSRVTVDGMPAGHSQAGQELTITPRFGLRAGWPFVVRVRYAGQPHPVTDPDGTQEGWIPTPDGAFVVGEPQGAPSWFPANDNPRDKASFSFAITVPAGNTAIANGRLVGRFTRRGRTTWRWREREPMAPYLATATNGAFELRVGHAGDVPLYWAADPAEAAKGAFDQLAIEPEVIDFLSHLYGPYPFSTGGGVVDHAPEVGYALESQTRSQYDKTPDREEVVHELSHQWFGDAVSLTAWPDIWLNEGFATFSQWIYDERHGGPSAQDAFDQVYIQAPNEFWSLPPAALPGAAALFSGPVYARGAATLQALRVTIGDRAFFRLLHAWYWRYRYGNATTADFIALAERVSGRDLRAFFDAWLYAPSKPARP